MLLNLQQVLWFRKQQSVTSATYFSQIASERHIILIQSDFCFNHDRKVTKSYKVHYSRTRMEHCVLNSPASYYPPTLCTDLPLPSHIICHCLAVVICLSRDIIISISGIVLAFRSVLFLFLFCCSSYS